MIFRIAGLEPVTWTHPRMRNVDLSSIVSGHLEYANKIDEILLSLGYADEEEDFGLRRCLSCHSFREHRDCALSRSESMDSFLALRGSSNSTGLRIIPEFKKK